MDAELLGAASLVARELHPANLDRLEARLGRASAGPSSIASLGVELSQASQRDALGKLARTWRASPSVEPAAVLAAIAAFRYSATRETRAEVCWSGPISTLQGFRTTTEAYREIIGAARRSALAISFALGDVAELRSTLEDAIERGVVTRLILEDFNVFRQESWRSQISNLGALVCERASIFVWPASKRRFSEGRTFGSMHVKAFVADEERLLLTSANWSGAAMQDNMELGISLRDEPNSLAIVRHFDHLIANGTLVRYSPQ